MGPSPLVVVVAVVVFFVAVSMLWWLRYNQKKSVVRNVTRRPHEYLGRMANNVYQIPMSQNYVYQTPPPSYSKAVKYPIPQRNRISFINIQIEDVPEALPTYTQYLKAQQVSEKQTSILPIY